jgi:hypothetical protein
VGEVERRPWESLTLRRHLGDWWLLFEGGNSGDGGGDANTDMRAAHLMEAFERPFPYKRVKLGSTTTPCSASTAQGMRMQFA